MANLIASPAQMALKLLEVEERLEKAEKRITNTKGKEWQKNQEK